MAAYVSFGSQLFLELETPLGQLAEEFASPLCQWPSAWEPQKTQATGKLLDRVSLPPTQPRAAVPLRGLRPRLSARFDELCIRTHVCLACEAYGLSGYGVFEKRPLESH